MYAFKCGMTKISKGFSFKRNPACFIKLNKLEHSPMGFAQGVFLI